MIFIYLLFLTNEDIVASALRINVPEPSSIEIEMPRNEIRHLSQSGLASYSQWGQDLVLQPILGMIKNGFFIESGAQDGESNSNTLKYELEGWSGMLVEPQPSSLKALRSKNRQAYIFPGALSPTGLSGTANLHEGGSAHSSGHLTSLFRDVTVPMAPVAELLQRVNRTTVDFWSLDIEGYEGAVLKGTDFSKIEVGVLLVETNKRDSNTADVESSMALENFKSIGHTYYKKCGAFNGIQSISKPACANTPWQVLDTVYVNPRYFEKRGLPVPDHIDDNRERF